MRAPVTLTVDAVETNHEPKPFIWTADPDKIIAAVYRGRQALDSTHSPSPGHAFPGHALARTPLHSNEIRVATLRCRQVHLRPRERARRYSPAAQPSPISESAL